MEAFFGLLVEKYLFVEHDNHIFNQKRPNSVTFGQLLL